MKYLDILKALKSAGKFAPVLLDIYLYILAKFEAVKSEASDSLQLVEPTEEEAALESEVAQALTADGSQAIFDGSRLRKLAALATQFAEVAPALFAIAKLFGAL